MIFRLRNLHWAGHVHKTRTKNYIYTPDEHNSLGTDGKICQEGREPFARDQELENFKEEERIEGGSLERSYLNLI